MQVHDWSRVPAGLFHDFHQSWSIRIKDDLNAGRLPHGIAALVEQRSGPKEPDVLAIESRWDPPNWESQGQGGVAVMEPPKTHIVRRTEAEAYAERSNRIVLRHHLGRIVAVIEIVSPGNKDSRAALRNFVEKTVDFCRGGIHVLVVDLFPPSPRDPFGLHKAIWDEFLEEDFEFPPGKDRILASYEAGFERAAYVEPLAVGDKLPDMPLFLKSGFHILVPLAATYAATWDALPDVMRTAVETGELPGGEEKT